jgi:hypothetical protein
MVDCDYIEYVYTSFFGWLIIRSILVSRRGSTVPNQPAGAFWAVINRLFIIFQVVMLILSEIGWPALFFDRFFPVLGKESGLEALGVFQCL